MRGDFLFLKRSIMNNTQPIKGYKVADSNGKCRGFQFETGKEYTVGGSPKLCNNGFHFCVKPSYCFNYYDFNKENVVFEIEAIGETDHDGGDKMCTNKIRIIRKIEWAEVLTLVNEGSDNTGHSNTGNSNTGDRNTGNSNTGNSNTGLFCTGDAPFPIFNMPSEWTEETFKQSKVYYLLANYVDTKMWVSANVMTEKEKTDNPSYKTAEGYVKDIPFKEAFQNAWHNFTEQNKNEFKSLPH